MPRKSTDRPADRLAQLDSAGAAFPDPKPAAADEVADPVAQEALATARCTLSVRLPIPLYTALKRHAEQTRASINGTVERAVADYLKRHAGRSA